VEKCTPSRSECTKVGLVSDINKLISETCSSTADNIVLRN
jgi:hypothetical protein